MPDDAKEIKDSGGAAEEKNEVEEEVDVEELVVPLGYFSKSDRDGKKCNHENTRKGYLQKQMHQIPFGNIRNFCKSKNSLQNLSLSHNYGICSFLHFLLKLLVPEIQGKTT